MTLHDLGLTQPLQARYITVKCCVCLVRVVHSRVCTYSMCLCWESKCCSLSCKQKLERTGFTHKHFLQGQPLEHGKPILWHLCELLGVKSNRTTEIWKSHGSSLLRHWLSTMCWNFRGDNWEWIGLHLSVLSRKWCSIFWSVSVNQSINSKTIPRTMTD